MRSRMQHASTCRVEDHGYPLDRGCGPPRRSAGARPRPAADTRDLVAAAVARYRREHDRYAKLADMVAEKCRRLLEANAILGAVDARAKSPESLERKLEELLAGQPPAGRTPEDLLDMVSDLAGVRVKTYVEADRDKVVEDIRLAFDGPGEGGEVDVEVKADPSRHYRAIHCQVILPPRDLAGRGANLEGTSCEIQVCSLLAHVWNEIEHNLVYKAANGRPSDEEMELLSALGALTKKGDEVLNALIAATRRRLARRTGEFTDTFDFVARMRERFPMAHNFEMHALALLEELRAFGLTTPQKVEEHLLGEGYLQESADLFEAFRAHQLRTDDWGVVLDPGSSDHLLVLLLARRAPEVLRRHQPDKPRGRLPRIARLARRFAEMAAAPAGGR